MRSSIIAPENETSEQKIPRLEKALAERDNELEKQAKELERRDSKIEKLINEIIALRRRIYGRSSERFIPEDPNQLSLAFEGMDSLPEEQAVEAEPEIITVTYQRRKENKKQPVREAIPDSIRRVDIVIEPENIPEGAVRIGEEVTEKLGYIPGEVIVDRTIRPKYALPRDGGIMIADLPSQVLPRSNAGASLLSYLLVSKYMDHIPFYRQLEMFKRIKIFLAASTVNGWFADAVDLLKPLYEALKKEVLSGDYIQIDESTIPVVDKDKPGSTRKGYHWIVKSPVQNQLFFHYQHGSRAQYVVVELLKSFQGAVQSDGYGAYDIYENKKGVLLLGCVAHSRRRFEQALKNDPERAKYALKVIRDLYAIEREAQEMNLPPDKIKELREKKSYPIIKDFEKWLLENIPKVLPKSLIGKAILYTYNIYPRLARYVLDGRYQIDNNGAENGVRPLALGYVKQMIMQSDTLLFIGFQHFNVFNNSYRFT